MDIQSKILQDCVHGMSKTKNRERISGKMNIFSNTYSTGPIQLHVSDFRCDCCLRPNQLQTTNMLYSYIDMFVPLFASINGMYVIQPHYNVHCVHKRIPHDAIDNWIVENCFRLFFWCARSGRRVVMTCQLEFIWCGRYDYWWW